MKGLSILIPVHEYNPTTLLAALHKQCAAQSIAFEIIVFDDGSSFESYNEWKQNHYNIINLHVYRSDKNLGRAGIRNELIKKASFNWLLFLDADTMPCTDTYIQQFIPHLTDINTCVCGGTAYTKTIPDDTQRLRWTYGTAREEISAEKRNLNPFDTFTLNNLLIRKELITKFPLDASITTYGHEDTLLGMTLAAQGTNISHIDNFVYHHGLDSNEVFFEKVKQSIATLVDLYKQNKLPAKTKLIKLHNTLQMLWLNKFVFVIIKPFVPYLTNKILNPRPSMRAMDLLKLYYFEAYLNRKIV